MNEDECELIHGVVMAKLRLERLVDHTSTANNQDLLEILSLIKQFLKKHCRHHFVRDYVDITPDRGMTVVYCELCETVSE